MARAVDHDTLLSWRIDKDLLRQTFVCVMCGRHWEERRRAQQCNIDHLANDHRTMHWTDAPISMYSIEVDYDELLEYRGDGGTHTVHIRPLILRQMKLGHRAPGDAGDYRG